MGLRYNPFTGSFDMTRSPGSYLDGEVAAYSDLPLDAAAAPLNSAWLVRAGSGLWLLTRKPAGIYIRTATGGTDRDADYTYAGTFPDVFSDANFVVYNDADSTKNLKLDTSGLTTGTTRTLTVPDASGTLPLLETANTFSANQTLNGTNNTAPNQTAASGSSLMTRDLGDARYRVIHVPFSFAGNNSRTSGQAFNILSYEAASALVTVPSFATKIKLSASIVFQTNPVAQTFDLFVSAHGTSIAGASLGSATTALTCTPESNNGSNSWRFELTTATALALPSGGATVATRVGFWTLILQVVNNSGGTFATVAGVCGRGMLTFEE